MKKCQYCGIEIQGNSNKKYCKVNHSPSAIAAKFIQKPGYSVHKPRWVNNKDIWLIYKNRPEGMVIDHIVPLKSEFVSGLHVPWNLQYLSKEDNDKKSATFDFTMDNISWRY